MLLLSFSLAGTELDAETLSAHWEASAELRTKALFSPTLGEEDLRRLAAGEVVVRRDTAPDGLPGNLGAVVVGASPELVWIALDDYEHNTLSGSSIAMEPIGAAGTLPILAYGTVALPVPLSDRQFVTRTALNGPLYTASEGALWERTILLDDPSLAPEPDAGKVWVERYAGDWLLLRIPEGTLVLYVVGSDIGGNVPAELPLAFAGAALEDVLGTLPAIAEEQQDHYGADHRPVRRPDGSVIPAR